MTERPIDERITEYRDSLRLTVDGVERLVDNLGPVVGQDLSSTARLLAHVADDLTKILDGVELKGWRIEGRMTVVEDVNPDV